MLLRAAYPTFRVRKKWRVGLSAWGRHGEEEVREDVPVGGRGSQGTAASQ